MSGNIRLFLQPLARACFEKHTGSRTYHRWVAPTLRALYNKKQKMGPDPPLKRSNFLEWNYEAELYSFCKRLGEEIDDSLLRQALTERSYITLEEENLRKVGIEPQLELRDNEELAEHGEVFIDDYSERYLVTILPRLPKQHLSAIKDDLLKEEQLAYISKNIGINDLVLAADHPPEIETLSRSFKAVVEALALSSGRDRAGGFVRDFVLVELAGKDISSLCSPDQPVKALQETLGATTESRLIASSGQNSILANYQVGIYKDKKLVGRGCGESPQIAEEMAALDGLWKIWGVPFNRRPFSFKLELPPA